jgi:uncharacterized membrane protein SpoIIM required for sporulation
MNIPFVQERKERWSRLDDLLRKAGKTKLNTFTKKELLEFCTLYQQAASDLALAKTQKLPEDLVYFLNDLVSRAYHLIYRTEKTTLHQLKQLFSVEYPELIRKNWKVLLFSILLLGFGWVLGFFGYLTGPEVVAGFLPKDFTDHFIKGYQNNTWFNEPLNARPFVSSWIMFNNIRVAIGAFAGGMLLGTLTFYMLVFNGFILGAISAGFWNKGYFLSFWAMILPHGVIELTAICLAAAAGFLLAQTIFFPGIYSRSDALKIHGISAIKLMFATILLFIVAGLIEGFLSTISTKIIPESYRLIFAGFTAAFLLWYFLRKPVGKAGERVFCEFTQNRPVSFKNK